ncbi:MAG: hypothetical protein AABY33_03350 [Pseudomonadota bacterium]
MTDNKASETEYDFREYYRQQRIDKLMALEEDLASKQGEDKYHQYLDDSAHSILKCNG